MTGVPGQPLPEGWDDIPGARGCTPQACDFRDRHPMLSELGVEVFGLSTQTVEYQREMANRLHLPFEILSDADWLFSNALSLPTFAIADRHFLKRLTLIIRESRIEHVFYPVFPPDQHAEHVIEWIKSHPL
jgi:peroxiredoxin